MGNMAKRRNDNKSKRGKGASETNKKENTPKWIVVAGGIVSVFAIITALWGIGKDIYEDYRKKHPVFSYETNFDWMSMDEVDTIITNESKVIVYAPKEDELYYGYRNAVALTALFTNLTDIEREIVSFAVYADDIIEDLSPDLRYGPASVSAGSIVQKFCNYGWGGSGPIHISVDSIVCADDEKASWLKLGLSEDAQTSWVFESLDPGEKRELTFSDLDDFTVEIIGHCEENDMSNSFEEYVLFYLSLSVYLPEAGYEGLIYIPLEASPTDVRVYHSTPLDPGYPNIYVIKIPTDCECWEKKYYTSQVLPANETVRLPIIVAPEKSCSMTVRVEFELSNGEIVRSEELVDTYIKVPYYDDWENYLNGELLGEEIVGSDKNISFPFVPSTSILP